VVRTFSNKAKNRKDKWEPKVGANRFVWDMRAEGVNGIEGLILWFAISDGPFVMPGMYSVELRAGEVAQSVPLTLLQDPRSSATPPDLQAQYDFVQSGIAKMNEINKTLREIRKVRDQLHDVRANINDETLTAEIDSMMMQAQNIEKALYQTKNRSPQDPLNFPIRLNNKYGHVIALATIGFNKPTVQMYGVKAELESLIDAELKEWETMKSEINSLNKKMRESETPFITW
jgi:hypothetical protein